MSDSSFIVVAGHEASGFESCRDLYAGGSDVTATGTPFYAHIAAHRFDRLLLFDCRPSGVAHSHDPGRVRRDGFDHFTLQLLCGGVFQSGALGEERPLAPGDIILFDMTRPQRTLAEGARVLTIALPRDVVEAVAPNARNLHGRVLRGDDAELLGNLMRSLARRGEAVPAKAAAHVCRALAELLAVALATDAAAERTPPERAAGLRLERAEAYVDAHLADPRLDAESVASGVGLSRSVLYRLFAPAGGVNQYILTRRLERLRAALRQPTELRSVSALAYDHGFSSESHCSRAFRAAYGVPPGRYRASMGSNRAATTAMEERPCETTSRGMLSDGALSTPY